MLPTKFLQSVCKWYQQIEEDLKCMEPGAQNAQRFTFFSYDIAKLTKNNKFPSVLYKVNGAMFEKNVFFSLENVTNEVSPISS